MFPSKHALAQGKAASPSRRPPDPRTHLRVGSGPSQLILSLLVVGFSLTPGLAALVPVVLRDAHRSVLTGKRKRKASWSSF